MLKLILILTVGYYIEPQPSKNVSAVVVMMLVTVHRFSTFCFASFL
jgi:hypothetical protein